MTIPSINLKDLVEAGVHFGHKTQRWNPKMSKYIHSTRENIHIINLNFTLQMLSDALKVVDDVVSKGGKILFVATKKQAASKIAELANEPNQYYVNHRWLGGMLTNWSTITNFPGGNSSFKDPTAETETISVTPNCFNASMFALKFIFDGDIKCPLPCLGKKYISLLLYLVFNILSDGFPQGVFKSINSLSLNSSTSYRPLPPIIANLLFAM